MKKKLLSVSILAMAVAMWGCGEDEKTTPEKTLVLSTTSVSVEVGTYKVIEVTDQPEGTVTWFCESSEIARVNSSGRVEGRSKGTTKVIASIGEGDAAKKAEVTVTVTDELNFPARKGSWLFDDQANLFKAEIGQALQPGKGSGKTATMELPTSDLSGFTFVPGPSGDAGAVKLEPGWFFGANPGFPVNPGFVTAEGQPATMINEYAIMWIVKFTDADAWNSLLQTEVANTKDGDCFVKDNTMGQSWSGRCKDWPVLDQGIRPVTNNEWHRIVFTMKCGEVNKGRYYCDGVYLPCNYSENPDKAPEPVDGERSLDPAMILLFGDEDGDQKLLEVAEIAIWDTYFTNAHVARLQWLLNNK